MENNLVSKLEFEKVKDEYEYAQKRRQLAIESFKQDSIFRKIQIKQLEASLDRMQKKYYRDLKELEQVLVKNLREQFFSLVEDFGEKEGYLLIINNFSVMYSPGSIDITDKLIKRLNDKYAKKSGN